MNLDSLTAENQEAEEKQACPTGALPEVQKDKMLYSVLPLNHSLTGPGACLDCAKDHTALARLLHRNLSKENTKKALFPMYNLQLNVHTPPPSVQSPLSYA